MGVPSRAVTSPACSIMDVQTRWMLHPEYPKPRSPCETQGQSLQGVHCFAGTNAEPSEVLCSPWHVFVKQLKGEGVRWWGWSCVNLNSDGAHGHFCCTLIYGANIHEDHVGRSFPLSSFIRNALAYAPRHSHDIFTRSCSCSLHVMSCLKTSKSRSICLINIYGYSNLGCWLPGRRSGAAKRAVARSCQ